MKLDKINALIIFVMLVSVMFALLYYNQTIINECTSNPLVFGAKKLEKDYGFEFHGTGYFLSKDGTLIDNRITFSSKNATIQ